MQRFSKLHSWSAAHCDNLLERYARCRILVIGDLMLDCYVWGRVQRISPEAPVQVLEVTRETETLGGAGNVVNNLRVFTPRVNVIGLIGEDAAGARVRDLFQALGVDTERLLVDGSRPTIQKTRIIAEHQQVLRIDRERRAWIRAKEEERIVAWLEQEEPEYDVYVLSDYGKGLLTDRVVQAAIAAAGRGGKPVVVDPKGTRYERYRGATLITPNRKEASAASGVEITDDRTLEKAVAHLRQRIGDTTLLITLGRDGMALFRAEGEGIRIPTAAREVFDVSGAGDTVVSLLALGLGSGCPLEQAAAVANAGAGIVVGKVGTARVSPGELKETLTNARDPIGKKVRDLESLAREIAALKGSGKTIVFTNGCFDLLHGGHIHLLEASKELGDVLVVALDDDESVQRIKGTNRPILKEEERLRILAALDAVDYLVLFSSRDLDRILATLQPDILTKGANYPASRVRGRETVERYGGRVVLIPIAQDRSVSGLIRSIRSNGGV